MQFHGLTALLLSLFVACVCAQSVTSTTTFTSTSTHTRTMTVSEVIASVTSTYSTTTPLPLHLPDPLEPSSHPPPQELAHHQALLCQPTSPVQLQMFKQAMA
ncbi:hypothetical protein H4I96_00439 [Botrytis cinerea]